MRPTAKKSSSIAANHSWSSIDRDHDAVLVAGDLDLRRAPAGQPGPDHPHVDGSIQVGHHLVVGRWQKELVLRHETVAIHQFGLGVGVSSVVLPDTLIAHPPQAVTRPTIKVAATATVVWE